MKTINTNTTTTAVNTKAPTTGTTLGEASEGVLNKIKETITPESSKPVKKVKVKPIPVLHPARKPSFKPVVVKGEYQTLAKIPTLAYDKGLSITDACFDKGVLGHLDILLRLTDNVLEEGASKNAKMTLVFLANAYLDKSSRKKVSSDIWKFYRKHKAGFKKAKGVMSSAEARKYHAVSGKTVNGLKKFDKVITPLVCELIDGLWWMLDTINTKWFPTLPVVDKALKKAKLKTSGKNASDSISVLKALRTKIPAMMSVCKGVSSVDRKNLSGFLLTHTVKVVDIADVAITLAETIEASIDKSQRKAKYSIRLLDDTRYEDLVQSFEEVRTRATRASLAVSSAVAATPIEFAEATREIVKYRVRTKATQRFNVEYLVALATYFQGIIHDDATHHVLEDTLMSQKDLIELIRTARVFQVDAKYLLVINQFLLEGKRVNDINAIRKTFLHNPKYKKKSFHGKMLLKIIAEMNLIKSDTKAYNEYCKGKIDINGLAKKLKLK